MTQRQQQQRLMQQQQQQQQQEVNGPAKVVPPVVKPIPASTKLNGTCLEVELT